MKLSKSGIYRYICLILTCFILITVLTACENADFIGNSYKTGNKITVEFTVMNSTEKQTLDLKSGDTVQFDITRESGKIDIAFGIKDAVPDYEGKAVQTCSFTVTVHKDGRYVLTVTGSGAKGSVYVTKK